MLYLPKLKTKILLILLCGLFCLHFAFHASKSYSVKIGEFQITNASEEQYQSCLNSLPYLKHKTEYINNTRVKYLYFLPEQSILFINLGYFLIISGLILSAKLKLNETANEN